MITAITRKNEYVTFLQDRPEATLIKGALENTLKAIRYYNDGGKVCCLNQSSREREIEAGDGIYYATKTATREEEDTRT